MAARKPATDTPADGEAAADQIAIVDGDTWAVVADREGVDVAALVGKNGGLAGQPLIVGEVLVRP